MRTHRHRWTAFLTSFAATSSSLAQPWTGLQLALAGALIISCASESTPGDEPRGRSGDADADAASDEADEDADSGEGSSATDEDASSGDAARSTDDASDTDDGEDEADAGEVDEDRSEADS